MKCDMGDPSLRLTIIVILKVTILLKNRYYKMCRASIGATLSSC